MNKWNAILLPLLTLSITLNLYLLQQQEEALLPFFDTTKNIQPTKITMANGENDMVNNQTPPQVNLPATIWQNDQNEMSREDTINLAENLLKQKKYNDLTSLLQSYLKQHPQDMEFLLIEARLKLETSLLSDAIAHYYSLLRHPMTATQQTEIEQQIQQLSDNSIKQLITTYSWDVLARFVEPLLQIDPENRLYILSLARAYAEQLQELLMENILASLAYDDPDAARIRQIVAAQLITPTENNEEYKPDVQASYRRPIPLKQFGDQYVVNGLLSSNPVDLLIDTGASITAISKPYFNKLSNKYKVNYLGRFSIGTAGMDIMARMYQFRELTIQHVTVENLPVVVLPMSTLEHADGLLGMNFLREFDFKIDQKRAVLMIE